MDSGQLMDIRGKIIAITGAAQGIGEATARLCAQRGANVIVIDVKEQGQEVAASIRQKGGIASFYQVDVRVEEQIVTLFEQIEAKHGHLDVLLCAAGVLQGQFLQPEEFPAEIFEFVMDVNVKGSFLCAKYATSLLVKAKRGVIILVASGAGVIGGSSSIAYGTSKGAVNGMGMTLENHLKPRGIRVNVVCPSSIETEMKLNIFKTQAERGEQSYEEILANSNLGSPIGVARLLAFLASDEADYVRRNMFTR